ncbi:MAG: hypothetical protein NZ908_00660 [Candidatus Micrarchaeota archaeon]|nr:hypothetical protein [Candidatus Micrarchaeota archaeon]MCX8154474.1 hypothetical protein [Candidatus Micrarchaeota archaeon]
MSEQIDIGEKARILNTKLNQLRYELNMIGQELGAIDLSIISLDGLERLAQSESGILRLEDLLLLEVSKIQIKQLYIKVDSQTFLPMSTKEAKEFLINRRNNLAKRYEVITKELKNVEEEIVKLLKTMR